MKDIRKLEAVIFKNFFNASLTLILIISLKEFVFCLGDPPQKFRMRGTVTLVSGDNLGSDFIGGYKQLSSAHRKFFVWLSIPVLENT